MKLIGTTRLSDDKDTELYEPEGGAQEIFVEGIHGISVRGPVVKFNWFVRDPSLLDDAGEGPEIRRVAVRVVMGIDTFFTCADFLKENADNLRKQVIVSNESIESAGEKH